MTASPRQVAINRIAAMSAPGKAPLIVDAVLEVLATPDADMLAGGLEELNLAMGKPADPKYGNAYRKALARVLYQTMISRAR